MLIVDIFIIVLGLVLGSFLYTTSIRLQKKMSLLERSKCPQCGNTVGIIGLLPVIGYLVLAGKCRNCRGRISPIYPAMEIFNAMLAFVIYKKTGWHISFIHSFIVFEALLLVAILDLKTHLIFPQPIVFGLIFQTFWLSFFQRSEIISSLLGLFIGAGVFHWIAYGYRVLRNRVGLGDGDATLLGMIGFSFGWSVLFSTIFWAALLGMIGGGILMITKKQSIGSEIAFGPWLVISIFLVWYHPEFFQSFPFKSTPSLPF